MPSDDAGFIPASALDLTSDGAAHHPAAALAVLPELDAAFAGLSPDRAGTRLHRNPTLADLLLSDPIHAMAATYLGPAARPVRAILFDKSPTTNWALGWHQDRTIVVAERHDVPGFGPWSNKAGLQHVEPPFALLAGMVTLRIHLDDVPADNAPLLISPGTHRVGRIAERDIEEVVARHGDFTCLARRGDVWAYATSIVHASAAATGNRHRRVLQVDYAAFDLPTPLQWRGLHG